MDLRRMHLRERGDAAENRHRRVVRHDHGDLETGRKRISRERIAGVALRRHDQLFQAELVRHARRDGHAAVLETLRRVRPEAGAAGLALVLDLQAEAGGFRERMLRPFAQRCRAFAKRDDVRHIRRIVDIQRQQCPEAPQVAPLRVIPRKARLLGAQARQVENHLDRTAVGGVEIHRQIGRILNPRRDSAQAAEVSHR